MNQNSFDVVRLFGTDGMRGLANRWPLTPQALVQIALAVGQYVQRTNKIHRVIIGKDTRQSGYMIETALTSGFLSMGMDVHLLGPLPTPAVAMLTSAMRADLGVMISASHNPYHDNGIKLFMQNSLKFTHEAQQEIESIAKGNTFNQAHAEKVGRARRLKDAQGRYIEVAKRSLGRKVRFHNLKIVLDCANGAAYRVAPLILWELGAEVIPINVEPDGTNINLNCGALYPESLQQAVVEHQADVGIALDGDADRLLLVDEQGKKVDGEQLLALIVTEIHERGTLDPAEVVTTKMTSRAFHQYCEQLGITIHTTPVGDRYVSEEMQKRKALIGGETSGHIILANYSYCSDGLIAALPVLWMLKERQQPLSRFKSCYTPSPILNHTFAWQHESDPTNSGLLLVCLSEMEDELKGEGRVFVRKSGTEPVIRILIECDQNRRALSLLKRITNALEEVEKSMRLSV